MRYSQSPFPAYRFVPGRAPHPTRDPDGHSYGRAPPALARFDEACWPSAEPYLHGVDLFNHHYWWEAHESWEACWVAAGRTAQTGLFVQGLIQISVACLKRHQGMADVGRRMAREGLDKFPRDRERMLGIRLAALRGAVRACFFEPAGPWPAIELEPDGPAPG